MTIPPRGNSHLDWPQTGGHDQHHASHVHHTGSRDHAWRPLSGRSQSDSTTPDLSCPDCSVTFSGRHQRRNRSRHLQSIHGRHRAQNLECQICHQQFNRSDAVHVHRRRKHETANQTPASSTSALQNEMQPTDLDATPFHSHTTEPGMLPYPDSNDAQHSPPQGLSDTTSITRNAASPTTQGNEHLNTPCTLESRNQDKLDCIVRKIGQARGQDFKCRFSGSPSMWALVQHLQSRAHRADFPILEHLRYCHGCWGLVTAQRGCQNCQNPAEIDRGKRRPQARGTQQPELWRALYRKIDPTATVMPSPYINDESFTTATPRTDDHHRLSLYSQSGDSTLHGYRYLEEILSEDEHAPLLSPHHVQPPSFDSTMSPALGNSSNDRTQSILFAPSSNNLYRTRDPSRLGYSAAIGDSTVTRSPASVMPPHHRGTTYWYSSAALTPFYTPTHGLTTDLSEERC